MFELTSTNVHATFVSSFFKEGEATDTAVIVKGVKLHTGFDPVRLEANKQKIIDMLAQLPSEFQQSGGGGMSFLNACHNAEGQQWADLHENMDQLVCLGLAIGKVDFNLPRALWQGFPGGMPYFFVKN